MTDISVIICTFNRCNYLPKLLESLRKQTLPEDSFEILVVDNNSTDETVDVIRLLQGTTPNLRYIFEPNQGLSIARNRGLSETRAPFVVYIDDDAYAEPQWLAWVLDAFRRDDDIVCVGGPVELDWQGVRPSWIPNRYESLFTSVDHGPAERFLSADNYLVGANIAFRHSWLSAQGGFLKTLGRKGASLLSGEEAYVYHRIFEMEKKAFYHPAVKVWHQIIPARRSRKWFIKRLFWDGATQPLLNSELTRMLPSYLSDIYVDIKRCMRFLFDGLKSLGGGNGAGFRENMCNVVQRTGRLYGLGKLFVRRFGQRNTLKYEKD